MHNEKVILVKVSEGNENAFRDLFEYYYPKVKAFLTNFIDNNADAEDLAQNIFVKIWLQRSILSEIRSFGAYLYTTTRNTAIDFGRVRKIRIPLTDENSADVATEYQSEHEFFAKETELQIAAVISKLPEKRRQVFVMSRMEGKTNGEIADIMGITKKTVENHLNLVLKELRKITISAECKGLQNGIDRLNELRLFRGLDRLNPSNEEEFIDAILNERRLELLGEGFRWFDLVRCGKYESTVGVEEKYTILPIPARELSLNNNLRQHPLWQAKMP